MDDKYNPSLIAARLIWKCWKRGETMTKLPEELQPKTKSDGYAIQAHFEKLTSRPLFGWKIAATSTAGQKHIGVSCPLAGRLISERVFHAGSILKFGANRMAVAEPEFAFRMGETLKPRTNGYSQEQVISAVETLHPGIEIPDSRFKDFAQVGIENLIADNACAHEFVIGAPMPDSWRSINLSEHSVRIYTKKGVVHSGNGSNVLGDPRIALTWLVNELSEINISINKGTTITTGTCTKPIPIKSGDTINADYGSLGQLEVNFSSD